MSVADPLRCLWPLTGTHDELVKMEIKKKGGTGEDKEDTVHGVYADLWKTQMRTNAAQK